MLAILAEDESDAEVIAHIVKRFLNNEKLSIKKKGYGGCAELRRKGARDIKSWSARGVAKFIVCHDADSESPRTIHDKVMQTVVRPSGVQGKCCIAVPVQEIEAWLIADETAFTEVKKTFQFVRHSQPEGIQSPKEWLIRQSKASNGKPLYSPKTFNAAVARHLRLDVVRAKCPSFELFLNCLASSI